VLRAPLALDHAQRDALAGHLDRVRVAELVRAKRRRIVFVVEDDERRSSSCAPPAG
jgi:hypothetical protein